ncbi:hypothetical protein KW801_02435 [Candidatus Saccharibacteria bacterium]|nr:hypothetical protein [Candidatus Saccharibacteria bacterium]
MTAGSAAAQGVYQSGTTGVDVSYPNCTAKIPSVAFGVVGVTGGLGFHPNNCLAAEAANFRNLSLYVNTGYPGQSYGLKYQNSPKTCDASDLNCLAYNYGYNAGQYALTYAAGHSVSSNTWWLDVETMNSWTNDYSQNIQSLQGETDALKAAGVGTIGVYSTTAQWGSITGGWQNGLPGWGATTWKTAKQAATYCSGHQFTGGPTYLIQYRGRNLDQDYAC